MENKNNLRAQEFLKCLGNGKTIYEIEFLEDLEKETPEQEK